MSNFPSWSYAPATFSKSECAVALAVGIFVLLHSFYLHRTTLKRVRVVTDVSAFVLVLAAFFSSSCYAWSSSCNLETQIVGGGLLCSTVFNMIIQASDNYLVYARYEVICEGVSKWHKIFTFIWIFSTCYLTWVPFYTIIPFFVDTNTPGVMDVYFYIISPIILACYLAYDMFYFCGVLWKIKQVGMNKNISSSASQLAAWKEFAVRALLHTVGSVASICVSAFAPGAGGFSEMWIVVLSNHLFLNSTSYRNMKFLRRLRSSKASTGRRSSFHLKFKTSKPKSNRKIVVIPNSSKPLPSGTSCDTANAEVS